jgi:hypothetical protein
LRGCAQLIAVEINDANAAASCEQRFIPICKHAVASTVGNHEHFEERQRRRHKLSRAGVGSFEQRVDQWQELRMLFDEVDEDGGVDSDHSAIEIGHQSHAARS